MEFENAFSRLGKVMDFRKNGPGHGKVVKFLFLDQIFYAVENWKYMYFSLSSSKICPIKGLIFAFLCHGIFVKKLLRKSHGIL